MRFLLSRVACLVLALVLVPDIGVALGSVNSLWQEVGGSASGDGVSQAPNPKMAFGARVAVGTDGPSGGRLHRVPDGNAVPNGDTTAYLCVRPVSSPHDAYLTYDLARLSLSLSGDI